MLIEVHSLPLTKAFTDDVQSRDWSPSLLPTLTEPDAAFGTGNVSLSPALGAPIDSSSVFMVPYSSGGIGLQFSMRVWGWKKIGSGPGLMWWPYPLVELTCTTTGLSGLPSGVILAGEYACDAIAVVQNDCGTPRGSLGPNGEIGGFGAGSGTTAFVVCNARGSQKITFDLKQDAAAECNLLFCLL